MPRRGLQLFFVGMLVLLAALGSSLRADATRGQPHLLTLRAEAAAAASTTLPAGFQESTVFDGLTFPTKFRFSPDGRVFVAEKSGVIKVFDSLGDSSPTLFADLSDEVDDYWDRGLLGLALDPNFPTTPYVYVLYTSTHRPDRPRRSGTTPVRPRQGRRPTAAWSRGASPG